MLRAVSTIHRYSGIVGCALMLLWCASGFVMMYVAYPSVSEARRLAGLQPLDLSALRDDLTSALPHSNQPLSVEMLDGQPVLRSLDARARLTSLSTRQPLTSVSRDRAARIARAFLGEPSDAATPRFVELVMRDQWTVSGGFNAERPLYLFAPNDAQRTRVYVSSVSGRVVQTTNARQRFWNWLGPIPHWLYLLELRQRPQLWRQVVMVAALVGCFLTASGLYLGFQRCPWRRSGAASQSARWLRWHHLSGVVFGPFAASWALSGLLSVQPWGLLDNGDSKPPLLSTAPSPAQLHSALSAFWQNRDRAFVSLTCAPLSGALFLIASTADGQRARFDALGHRAPLVAAEIDALARHLGSPEPAQRLNGEDAYLFSHHDEQITLPAYRIRLPDQGHSDLYVDAVTGLREAFVDRDARAQRWVDGVHRFDLLPILRTRPLWDLLMWLALTGVGAVSVTGAVLAYRRLFVRRP